MTISPTCADDSNGVITVVTNTPSLYFYSWAQDPALHTATATGLPVGAYSVTVSDTSGCVSVLDTVILPPVVPDLGGLVTTDISCAGLNDGIITLTVNQGPYTWHWQDEPTNTELTRDSLGTGLYVVEVNGGPCPSYLYAFLGDPGITIDGETTYCPSSLPVLSANGSFGFQPDVFEWSTGDTTASFTVAEGTQGPVHLTAINSSTGCTNSADIVLTMLPSPTVTFTAPDSLCIRSQASVNLILSNADSLVWRWGTDGLSNERSPVIIFHDPEWQPISLQGFDSLGCGSAPVIDSIYVRPIFPAVFTAQQVPCTPGIEVHFDSDADSCAFFAGDRLVLGQCRGAYQVDLERYAEYDFTFYSTRPDHCDDTSKVHIDVRTVPTAFLPNSFSPNGDNINDKWPGLLDIPDLDYRVQIFDRWGELLWSTNNTEEKWDGGNLPTGVYVYVMHMRDPCQSSAQMSRNGTVTLLR